MSQKLALSLNLKLTHENGKVAVYDNDGKNLYVTSSPEMIMLINGFSQTPMTLYGALKKLKEHNNISYDLEKSLDTQLNRLKEQNILSTYCVPQEEFFKSLNKKRREMTFLKYDDWNMTVSNCGKKNLSPGCKSCKDGRWICIFPGFTCNAECGFCPRLTQEMTNKPLMSQMDIDLLLMKIDSHKDKISGISISGGEVFFKNYNIAKQLIRELKNRHPNFYFWAYTNGLAATKNNMRELRDLGLDELRFNLAASDFNHEIIYKIKKYAVKIYPWVTVEIPIYDKSFDFLIKHEKLKELSDIGVKQLNLAEVRIPFDEDAKNHDLSPAAKHFLNSEEVYLFDKKPIKVMSVINSRFYTYDIFKYAHDQNIDIHINDCSQEAKFVQIVTRKARGLDKISSDVDAFDDC